VEDLPDVELKTGEEGEEHIYKVPSPGPRLYP
jgi:hypothetical protein